MYWHYWHEQEKIKKQFSVDSAACVGVSPVQCFFIDFQELMGEVCANHGTLEV